MSDDPVVVGYVKRAHGIRGGLLVVPLSDDPDLFRPGAVFGVANGSDDLPSVTVTSVTTHNEGVILRVEESWDRNRAEALAKKTLTIDRSQRRALAQDEYWPEDLVGRAVRHTDGSSLGTITEVVIGEAQDRLIVMTSGGLRVEVPFVAAFVEVPTEGAIVVDPPDGLFPEF